MKPFDLEKALAGEPVNVIGDTVQKRIIAKSAYRDDRYIVEDNRGAYRLSLADLQEEFEMWQEPRPRVQLDLPAPLKEPQEGMWFLDKDDVSMSGYKLDIHNKWMAINRGSLNRGFYFATKEDAKEWLDAMRNARR